MKKTNCKAPDELRYKCKRSDFGRIERGKYAARTATETNVVVLEPEVAEAFPNDKAVNAALRGLLEVAAKTARLTRRSTKRAKAKGGR